MDKDTLRELRELNETELDHVTGGNAPPPTNGGNGGGQSGGGR